MTRTRTRVVSFESLEARGESAKIIIRLMMACNDLTVTNRSLGEWKTRLEDGGDAQARGAAMYFIRAQMSHLYEGFKIIESIQSNRQLRNLLERCDDQTKESYRRLRELARGGTRHSDLQRLIGRPRNNITFHYDESGDLIGRGIARRAVNPTGRMSTITRGGTAHQWYFRVADDIVNSIMVREIWRIPGDSDLRVEVDHVTDEAHQILLWFVDFSGEFVWKYLEA